MATDLHALDNESIGPSKAASSCRKDEKFPPHQTTKDSILTTTPFRPGFTTGSTTSAATMAASNCKDDDDLYDLIHYATLAPSSHNTQCWKFQVVTRQNNDDDSSSSSSGGSFATISILPDFSRSCPVVDPDDHHLYVSLGCAVENLIVAAQAYGYNTRLDASHPINGLHVHLSRAIAAESQSASSSSPEEEVRELFRAIPKRQVSRCEYNGQPLQKSELEALQRTAAGYDGVKLYLVTDRDHMKETQNHILRANTAQMSNPRFKTELGSWIRFNEKDAVAHGDGLYSKTTGNPSAPTFLGKAIFNFVVRPSVENSKISQQIQSSAGFAIFVSKVDDPTHWVQAGRCYERFALQATAMGIRNAMLNQPVEEAGMRPAFAEMLGLLESDRPDLVVRFGKGGPEMQAVSPRRPLQDVVCSGK